MKKLGLLILVALFPSLVLADTLQTLENFIKNVKTAKGTFIQTVVDKTGRQMDTPSEGTFFFSRPGKFLWKYQKPYEQEMVCNGKELYLWDKDLEQVTIRSAAGAIPKSPASILFGGTSITKDWNVKDLGTKDSLQWIQLIPKTETGEVSYVSFGFSGDYPKKIEFMGSFGEKTSLELTSFLPGEKFPDKTFDFKIPKGADVVRMK